MTNRLDDAPPADRSRWPQRFRAALAAAGVAAVAVVAAGGLGTAAMHGCRWWAGQPTLFGLPGTSYYQLATVVFPALLLTGLTAAGRARAVRRCGRGDRLLVALLAAGPLAGLWCAGMCWLLVIALRPGSFGGKISATGGAMLCPGPQRR